MDQREVWDNANNIKHAGCRRVIKERNNLMLRVESGKF